MKILNALILLLVSSVCSAAPITIEWPPVTTRTDSTPVVGVIDYLVTVNGLNPQIVTGTSVELDVKIADVVEVATRETNSGKTFIGEADQIVIFAFPAKPNTSARIVYTVGE